MRQALGITRVGDVTGLDRLGVVPVVQVTRPFSLSNAVTQGKGATLAEAAVSALLESAEGFFAERMDRFQAITGSAETLDVPRRRFDNLLRPDAPRHWREMDTAWLAAEDLVGSVRSLVPLELVHTAWVMPALASDGLFAATTTGLAAAFEETDATVHAILECLERDALARAHRMHGFLQRRRIDPATIDDPDIRALLDRLAAASMLVGLWHAPSPAGLPVVWCHLMEDRPRETALLHLPADGSAAGFDASTAIVQAIREAAQARIAAISGARDDITRASYPRHPDWQHIVAHQKLLREGSREVRFQEIPKLTGPSSDAIHALLGQLEAAGIDCVLKVRLDTSPLGELAAVRIVIPQLLPMVEP